MTTILRTNRFAGKCADCGGWVPAETGTLTKANGKWVVGHNGPCPVAAEKAAKEVLPEVPAGYYAIPCADGHNDLSFYRVDRPTKGRWVGYTFVKEVIGGQGAHRVARGDVKGILARILDDTEAGPRYGQEIGRCYVCNRLLTDEESRRLGIGPDCRKRQG